MVLDSLYFGTAKPGGIGTSAEWSAFLNEIMVSDFPEGLTSRTASRGWRDSAGLVKRETSYILQLAQD